MYTAIPKFIVKRVQLYHELYRVYDIEQILQSLSLSRLSVTKKCVQFQENLEAFAGIYCLFDHYSAMFKML